MSYHHSSSYSVKRRSYVVMISGIVLLIAFLSASLVGYHYRAQLTPLMMPIMQHVEKVKTWMGAQSKKSSGKTMVAAVSVEKEKPVHFEFYSALPEMAVDVPKQGMPEEKAVTVAVQTKPTVAPFIASRDELVKEFADKINEE